MSVSCCLAGTARQCLFSCVFHILGTMSGFKAKIPKSSEAPPYKEILCNLCLQCIRAVATGKGADMWKEKTARWG